MVYGRCSVGCRRLRADGVGLVEEAGNYHPNWYIAKGQVTQTN
jgi:hypothetical protein